MICKIGSALGVKEHILIMMNLPHVKWICIDGGGYYVCKKLDVWRSYPIIVQKVRTTYWPESNVKDDVINSTLMDCFRYILMKNSQGEYFD